MMIGTRLRSAALVAGVMASALTFYMVSLRVAAERSAVEKLQGRIASNMAAIRQLQSELGTRERLPQLERWNANVLALSAPKAGQYLDGTVELAAFAGRNAPNAEAQVRPAIAVEQPHQPAQVQTVAYAKAEPARQPGQPVVTFAAAREDQAAQPLLRTVAYSEKPVRRAPVTVSTSVLSDSLLSEIRDAAAIEATGLRRAAQR